MVRINIACNLKTFPVFLGGCIRWNVFISIWKDFNPVNKRLEFELISDVWVNEIAVKRSNSKRIFAKVPKDAQ